MHLLFQTFIYLSVLATLKYFLIHKASTRIGPMVQSRNVSISSRRLCKSFIMKTHTKIINNTECEKLQQQQKKKKKKPKETNAIILIIITHTINHKLKIKTTVIIITNPYPYKQQQNLLKSE